MKHSYRALLFVISMASMLILTGCITNMVFEKTIEIDAPADTVFSIITDYESYDELLPMLHDTVQIVSEQKTGPGVVWTSTGSFKGHKFTSQWTVTDYRENEMVQMKDLKGGIGETTLSLTPLAANKTGYKMYIMTKMYKPYENDFVAIYEKEMDIIKNESEKRYKDGLK